jgi:DNA-directed RNA polymerase specialized sigma24 family protein
MAVRPMSGSASSFPSALEGLCLHERLCRPDDPQATAAIVAAYLQPLLDFLRWKHPEADNHLRVDAVHRALLDYLRSPERFCPGRGSLANYLRWAALGDLRNLLRNEARHHRRREFFSVEEGEDDGNYPGGDETPAERLCREEEAARGHELLSAVEADCSPDEQCVFALMRDGNAGTASCAAVLGLGHLSADEQERYVKRVKDRIKKRIERRSA